MNAVGPTFICPSGLVGGLYHVFIRYNAVCETSTLAKATARSRASFYSSTPGRHSLIYRTIAVAKVTVSGTALVLNILHA